MTANEPMPDERLARLAADNEPVGDHLSGLTAEEVAELVDEVKRARVVEAELRGHLDAIRVAHREGVMAGHQVNETLKQHVETAERELAESRNALTVAAELIDRLAFDDECDYDHHGACQAHNLHGHPCPHPLGRQFVEAWRAVEAEQKEAADDA